MNTLTAPTTSKNRLNNFEGKLYYKSLKSDSTMTVPAAIEAVKAGISVWDEVAQSAYDNWVYDTTCQLTPWPVGMTKEHKSVQSFLEWSEDEYCPDDEHTHYRMTIKSYLGGLEMLECSPYNSREEDLYHRTENAISVKFVFPYECNEPCFTVPTRERVQGENRIRAFFFIPAKFVTVVSHHDRDVFILSPEGKAMMNEKITSAGKAQIAKILANKK